LEEFSYLKGHPTLLPIQNGQSPVRVAVWILLAAEHITRLLAASFDLPDSIWHRRLDHFQADLRLRFRELYPIIWPSGQPPVERELNIRDAP
jgi:hypothetical protein